MPHGEGGEGKDEARSASPPAAERRTCCGARGAVPAAGWLLALLATAALLAQDRSGGGGGLAITSLPAPPCPPPPAGGDGGSGEGAGIGRGGGSGPRVLLVTSEQPTACASAEAGWLQGRAMRNRLQYAAARPGWRLYWNDAVVDPGYAGIQENLMWARRWLGMGSVC